MTGRDFVGKHESLWVEVEPFRSFGMAAQEKAIVLRRRIHWALRLKFYEKQHCRQYPGSKKAAPVDQRGLSAFIMLPPWHFSVGGTAKVVKIISQTERSSIGLTATTGLRQHMFFHVKRANAFSHRIKA